MAERAQKKSRDEPRLDPVATAQNPLPKVDAAEAVLIRRGELCALEGRTNELGLAAIARPANATLH